MTQVDFLVRDAIFNAINTVKVDPETKQQEVITKEVSNKIFQIGVKLFAHNEVDFTGNEIAFIKERAEVAYVGNPLVFGRLMEILGGTTQAVPEAQPVEAVQETN